MGGGVGELERTGNVACGVDVRIIGLQKFVGVHSTSGRNAQFFQAETCEICGTANGNKHGIEGNPHILALAFSNQDLLTLIDDELLGAVIEQYIDPFRTEALGDQVGDFRVFSKQDARRHFHLRHLGAQACKGLGQFRTNRAAAQYHEALGQFTQIPHRVRSQRADFFNAGDRRHEGPRAGGDDDAARCQALGAAVLLGDVDLPGRDDFCAAVHHINPQFGVALGRVMGLDGLDHRLHALHDIGKGVLDAG